MVAPAGGRQKLELLFADAEREELAVLPEAVNGEYQNRPGQVLLFFNDRGAELSGYFTVPESGEQLRPSVFMDGRYGTGPLQTEGEYRAALADRQTQLPAAAGSGTHGGTGKLAAPPRKSGGGGQKTRARMTRSRNKTRL